MFKGLSPGAGHYRHFYRSIAVVALLGLVGLIIYWMVVR